VKDLLESHEFDQFMQDHGWSMVAPIPARPQQDMRFDVPFSVMPMAGANGTQRSLYQ
jgi:hypothetical protein